MTALLTATASPKENPMSTTTHTITLVNLKDGLVQGHKAGCADLKTTTHHADEPWTFEVENKHAAWLAYNSDFIAECDEHEDYCNEDREICSSAWGIHWLPCADHVPSEATAPAAPAIDTAPQVTIKGTAFKGCACHCGQPVPNRSSYRPGHDARHAGQVARAAVEAYRNGQGAVDSREFYMELAHRPALHAKALRMAVGIVAKDEGKKTGRTTPAQEMTGVAKVGRWTYPARMTLAGKAQRNSKRDGSGEWISHTGDIAWD